MSKLNPDIKVAIDTFDLARARELLREAFKEADAETYYLASKVAIDDDQKREFLEKSVAIDPFHEKARKELRAPNATTTTTPTKEPVATPSSPKSEAPVADSSYVSRDTSTPKLPSAVIHDELYPLQRYGIPDAVIQKLRTNKLDMDKNTKTEFTVIQAPVELRTLPIHTSAAVAELRNGTEVIPFQRTQDMDWVRVIYQSPLGSKDGWVPSASLPEMTIDGYAVPLVELPILDYADAKFGYSRSQVLELIGLKSAFSEKLYPKLDKWGVTGLPITLLCCVGAMITSTQWYTIHYDLNVSRYPHPPSTTSIVLALVFTAVTLLLGWYYIKYARNILRKHKFKPVVDYLATQLKALNTTQKNLRSDYEVMRDDQRNSAALGFAANLGATLLNTAASRYIPNRQKITVETGSSKKK